VRKLPICLALILLFVFPLSAKETIALHPFWGEPEEAAELFYDVLIRTMRGFSDSYTAYPISLNPLPPDIPPGGFPANVCPSPALTAGASYAITGRITEDVDFHDSYRVRLYLWMMEGNYLLAVEEMTANDRYTSEARMPHLLGWLLSWIDKTAAAREPDWIFFERPTTIVFPPSQARESWDSAKWLYIGPKNTGGEATTAVENPEQWVYLGPESEKWFRLGMRTGMGTSQWYNKVNRDTITGNLDVSSFWNAFFALHASVRLLRFLDFQTEVNVAADFGSAGEVTPDGIKGTGIAASWSVTIPLLAKLTLRGSHLSAGIFAGPYLYLPLAVTNGGSLNEYLDYKPDFPGLTAGLSLGWRLGPGNIFLDGRFEYDGHWYSENKTPAYYRNTVKISTGYEFGILNKK
jgi:hypothetical protein